MNWILKEKLQQDPMCCLQLFPCLDFVEHDLLLSVMVRSIELSSGLWSLRTNKIHEFLFHHY